jgi:uncharacterized protein involved in exopolysaccharide biosynthesis
MKREQSTVAGLQARMVQLEEQKKAVLADITEVNEHELAVDQLTRAADLARGKYMQYAQTMEEARIDRDLQTGGISNISVAQKPTLAEKPVVPSKAMTAAGTFLFAIAGTIGLILFGERNNVPIVPAYVGANGYRRARRRSRRESMSKANGHSSLDEIGVSAKAAK